MISFSILWKRPNLVLKYHTFLRYPEIARIERLEFVLHQINLLKKYLSWVKDIIPVFLVHTFNVTSTLCFVKYVMISNIHNRTPKSCILFTDFCIKYLFNWHDFMNHSVVVCIAILINLFRINEELIRIINCEPGRRRSDKVR